MKHQITSHAFTILFLATLPTQAADTRMRKAPKPLRNKITRALHKAVKNNDVKRVRLLIKGGYDVNKQDSGGWVPLHWAAMRGHIEVAQQLVKADADVNKPEYTSQTPLHKAASNGHIEAVRLLIKAGADVNKQDGNSLTPYGNSLTPLHMATGSNHIEIAQQLLKAGAEGLTVFHALMFAISSELRTKYIKLFIHNRPILARMENEGEKTALACARDLDPSLMELLENPEKYIKQHPEEFTFIHDIEYTILKKTTPDLFGRIRNRQLGIPLHAKYTRRNQVLRATVKNSKQKKLKV